MTRLLPLVRHARPAAPEADHALVDRFARLADQAAFAELVHRHGPMVLGVCQRSARDPHLAEDAFQATFLVLARRAGSLRNPAALGCWLFGVARRVGLAARRRHRPAAEGPPFRPAAAPPDWDDLLRVLDEELARLPEKYRAPLLACYLEGLTRDEAAARLGWSVSTVGRRVAEGRELLRARMTRRGATLAGGLVAGLLAPAAVAAVHDGLAGRVADLAAGGPVPPAVRGLAATTAPSGFAWATAAAVVIVSCGLALGTGGRPGQDRPAAANPPPPPAGKGVEAPAEPLPPGAAARMGSHRLRHPSAVESLAFGLGGTVLVSAHEPGACVWDVGTGQLLQTLGRRPDDETAEAVVAAVGLSADGRTLTVSGRRMLDKRSFVSRNFTWSLEGGGKELRTFAIRQDVARRGAHMTPHVFAPNGTAMAEVDFREDAVWVWDGDGNPVAKLDGAVGNPQ
ncbi:MAG TPA: sigma-70 family RNA polymerase sigma factor, partial [Urbifossiella sp.]|nr:sigma-70 family RNA polymerase sigma factor [Urbifossiella sp.]